ncbi:MAG TPA: hypothetical protein VKK31_01545 [Thermoanaerobaculia bacterium]|nr:hypothetical protein [Thermoanaerobaculia bacterium]
MRALPFVVIGLLLGQAPAGADLLKLTVQPCNGSTIFLERMGDPWPGLPESYSVALLALSEPDATNPEGNPRALDRTAGELVSFEGRTLLRARFATPIPGEEALRVVVRSQDERALAVGDFSTKSGGTIKHNVVDPSSNTFDVDSKTPLAAADSLQIEAIDPTGTSPAVHSAFPVKPLLDPQCETPDARSGIVVKLAAGDEITAGSAIQIMGLRDVYGSAISPAGNLTPPLVPRGKEDAFYFLRFLFESAAGSANALSVDLKAQPAVQLRGDWLFRPELTAFVSRNLPGATNSIRLASLFSHTTRIEHKRLVTSTISFGPSLEADRDFDRVNGVIDLRWQPGFANLYHPREKTALVTGRKLQEIPFGWLLEGRLGLEAGRSRYDILRLRPVIHGNLEYKKLGFDVSSSLRYLFTDELTAPQKVKGSRPFTEATLGYFLDQERHLSLAVTYKNGSEPPLFVSIERVSLGLVAKY